MQGWLVERGAEPQPPGVVDTRLPSCPLCRDEGTERFTPLLGNLPQARGTAPTVSSSGVITEPVDGSASMTTCS